MASRVQGAGVYEQGMSSRDRREPGRSFEFRIGRYPALRTKGAGDDSKEVGVVHMTFEVGEPISQGPNGGKGPPEEEIQ